VFVLSVSGKQTAALLGANHEMTKLGKPTKQAQMRRLVPISRWISGR
jgi:hypothetical protein